MIIKERLKSLAQVHEFLDVLMHYGVIKGNCAYPTEKDIKSAAVEGVFYSIGSNCIRVYRYGDPISTPSTNDGVYTWDEYVNLVLKPKSTIPTDEDGVDRGAKYRKTIYNNLGESLSGVDIYDMAEVLDIRCNAQFHAWKKVTMAGQRGSKGFIQDMDEAINSIERAKRIWLNKNQSKE